jgi:S1-C subfamily serine protease
MSLRGLRGVARVTLLPWAVAPLLISCAPVPSQPPVASGTSDAVEVLSATAEAPPPPALRGSSIERAAQRQTVRVRARGCGRLGTASAVAVAPRLLVTNRHVVADAEELELNYWDGTSARARLEALSVADDLALVKVSLRLPAVARVAASDPSEHEEILVVGYPNGGEQTVERGEVVEYARLREPRDASPVMRVTADIVPGNSGGAVVNRAGDLVGVVFGVETETGFGLAIPASAVQALLDDGGAAPAGGCP